MNQKGFSVVAVLLIVISLGLVAGIGYYVWQNNSSEEKSAVSKTNNTKSKTTNTTSNPTLTIEKYMVRVPLDETTSGLKVGTETASAYSASDSSIPVLAPGLQSGWDCEGEPTIGTISVTKQAQRSGPGQPASSVTLAGYTYGYEPGGANCSKSPLYQKLVESFTTQFKSLESY